MYYILYGLLYAISLLPFRILYGISDIICFVVYNVAGYRKQVVMENLAIAFPEKSLAEKKKIAKGFYRNFIDSFIETIKTISISDKGFDKRCNGNFEVINEVIASGQNVHLIGAHMFNWEYANLIVSRNIKIKPIGIYTTIESKTFERIILKIRARYGTLLISKNDFRKLAKELLSKSYIMYLLADQNTAPEHGIWMDFFGKPVPFIPGAHKSSIKHNAAVIYINFKKGKRGYYTFNSQLITKTPGAFTVYELLKKYRNFLEQVITEQPSNYLWTHRRWKHNFDDHSKINGAELIE